MATAVSVSPKRPVPSQIFTSFLQREDSSRFSTGPKITSPGTADSGDRTFLDFTPKEERQDKGPINVEAGRLLSVINELIQYIYLMTVLPFTPTPTWSSGGMPTASKPATRAIFSSSVDIQTFLWYSRPPSDSTLPSICVTPTSGKSSAMPAISSSRGSLSTNRQRCKSLEGSIPKIIITPPDDHHGPALRRSKTTADSFSTMWQDTAAVDSGFPKTNSQLSRMDTQNLRAPTLPELKKIRAFLKSNQEVADKLEDMYGSKRSPASVALIDALRALQQQCYERVCRTANEDLLWKRQLNRMSDTERRNLRKVDELEILINAEMERRNAEMFKRDGRIDELQEELQHLNETSEHRIFMAKDEVAQTLAEMQSVSSSTRMELQLELDQLQARLMEKEAEDRLIENQLRQARIYTENQLLERVHCYDRDMLFKQTTLEDLSREFEREKAHLQLLERRLDAVEGDYKRILEERQKEVEQHKQRVHKLKQVFQAAVMIKTYFRNFKRMKQVERSKKHKRSSSKKQLKEKNNPPTTKTPQERASTAKDVPTTSPNVKTLSAPPQKTPKTAKK